MGSTRLPGKVLLDLAGRPVLEWVVRAAHAISGVDAVWIATSDAKADDPVAQWSKTSGVECFRGSESDVLSRYAGAAKAGGADIVVRITSDCPFLDPQVAAQVLYLRSARGACYASNVDPPTWPDGLDCEVFTADALFAADREAKRKGDREHVTPFIRRNRARFPAEVLVCPMPGLAGERWTLDTPEDHAMLSAVAEKLPKDAIPAFIHVLSVLNADPALRKLNRGSTEEVRHVRKVESDAIEPLKLDETRKTIERAEKVIPLGSQTFSKSRLQFPPGASPLFVSHGLGGRVIDVDGNEYVDLVNALLPNILGYCDPDVDYAIRRQLTRGISMSLPTTLEVELAERLVKHIPSAEMVRFGKNGTDATSAAIRLARAATRRERVIAAGYHGWQDWYIGATARRLGVPAAVSALTEIVPFGDLSAMEKTLQSHPSEYAAIILEPTGAIEPPQNYLADLKRLAHKHGALLIFDEIITGFRWGLGGAQARYGVTPDMSSFGKAMGNGMPISAVVGRADIMKLMEDIFYSGTFGGEALSLAAAIATIEKIEHEGVVERLWSNGQRLREDVLAEIVRANVKDVVGLVGSAPWVLLTFKDHAKASKDAIKTLLLREMIAAGVLLNASHNICFAHTQEDIDRVVSAYARALPILRDAIDAGDIEKRLGNQIIRPVFSVRSTQ